jgi:hypothetical protein
MHTVAGISNVMKHGVLLRVNPFSGFFNELNGHLFNSSRTQHPNTTDPTAFIYYPSKTRYFAKSIDKLDRLFRMSDRKGESKERVKTVANDLTLILIT